MIRVLFFARLREQLGCGGLDLEWDASLASVSAVRTHLQTSREGGEALSAENIVCALNQQQVDPEQPVRDGDEVAFYPPVTGG